MAQAWPLLRRMVLVMAGMLGMDEDSAPERVSRCVRIAVLRILRPAEALTRRLIVLMAREMDVTEALNKPCRDAARSGGQTLGTAARRHAIFLERDRRSNQLPGRINPIRPGPAPGMRSRHTPPDLKELLLFIGIEAQRGPPRPTPARLTLS